jgi:hypothetical protein
MSIPRRLEKQEGRAALVDGIPFTLPIRAEHSPAFMAAFPVNYDRARALLPGSDLHPLRLWNKAVLLITVIDYRSTVIGKYIEFCVAIACTKTRKPAPRLLPAIFMKHYGTGQFVVDLPVSTEISVKGGKTIWGMPKHQANLDFHIGEREISSQYDKDGQLVMKIEIDRPERTRLPVSMGASSYSAFRGLLTRSRLYFKGRAGFKLFGKASARLYLGRHPKAEAIRNLEIEPDPLMIGFFPDSSGLLDDHFECWFLDYDRMPVEPVEGLESVIDLGLGQEWLPPPSATVEEIAVAQSDRLRAF